MLDSLTKAWSVIRNDGVIAAVEKGLSRVDRILYHREYRNWIKKYERLDEQDLRAIAAKIDEFPHKPLISVMMPVYNVEAKWLKMAIDSVRDQVYTNWELCIADDHSSKPHIREVLDEYSRIDERIKVVYREENGHISAASNSALELVGGEFTALMDHDDLLARLALYFVASEVNKFPKTDIIYTDEDKISIRGRRFAPTFKADWSPDLMNSINLFTHLVVYRTRLIKDCGFRSEFDGSQDYDLALRAAAKSPAENIRHVPRVLYHWRTVPGSVALASGEKHYAHERARQAITEQLQEKAISATTTRGIGETHHVKYALPDPPPMISVIVAAGESVLGGNIRDIFNGFEEYPFDVVIVGGTVNNTNDRTKIIASSGKGLFADLNAGTLAARGSILLFLDESTVKSSEDWLTEMVGLAIQKTTGAIGSKLVSPDHRIKFAGCVIGLAGGIGSPHRGFKTDRIGNSYRLAVIQNVSAISADCLMIRRSVFERVGGFASDRFPNAYADVDLCLRLLEGGYRNIWTPWAEFVQTSDLVRSSGHEFAELKNRWPEYFERDPYYNPNLTLETEGLALADPPRTDKY